MANNTNYVTLHYPQTLPRKMPTCIRGRGLQLASHVHFHSQNILHLMSFISIACWKHDIHCFIHCFAQLFHPGAVVCLSVKIICIKNTLNLCHSLPNSCCIAELVLIKVRDTPAISNDVINRPIYTLTT